AATPYTSSPTSAATASTATTGMAERLIGPPRVVPGHARIGHSRGISSSVERELPKLERRARFPYPALAEAPASTGLSSSLGLLDVRLWRVVGSLAVGRRSLSARPGTGAWPGCGRGCLRGRSRAPAARSVRAAGA